MRFGKPALTAEPPPATPDPIPVVLVKADVRGNMEWTWTFRGETREADAMALLAKLTGDPDENGWIRDNDGDWAYRADEIRSVTFRRKATPPTDGPT